jgi:hypothetical protein
VLTTTVLLTQLVVLQVPAAFTKYVVVDVGNLVNETPFPSKVPVQLELYQFQFAPVPRVPPIIVSITEFPIQIEEGVAEIEVADVDKVLTVTMVLTQLVVLHVPAAFT